MNRVEMNQGEMNRGERTEMRSEMRWIKMRWTANIHPLQGCGGCSEWSPRPSLPQPDGEDNSTGELELFHLDGFWRHEHDPITWTKGSFLEYSPSAWCDSDQFHHLARQRILLPPIQSLWGQNRQSINNLSIDILLPKLHSWAQWTTFQTSDWCCTNCLLRRS